MKKLLLVLMVFGFASVGLAQEKLTDGGLENWTGANNLTSWTESSPDTSDVYQDSTEKHGGSYCARLEVDGSGSIAAFYQSNISLTNTNECSLTFWHKETGSAQTRVTIYCKGCTPDVYLQASDTTTWATGVSRFSMPNSSSWVERLLVFPLDSTNASYTIYFDETGAADETLYVDDASFIEYTPSSTSPQMIIISQ